MKYTSLRTFMKKKKLSRPYTYANKKLVIDGQCFKDIYKNSGCQFALGGEYDRFASYLKSILSVYIKCNIDCYIVFNGAMNADNKTRSNIHQNIIDRVESIGPGNFDVYCEPIFVKDVYKDVLDELGIKYYICMSDSKETLFSLAKQFKCPILSNNYEYAFYNVPVIKFQSVVFNESTQSISCSIYFTNVCRQLCRVSDDVMTVALVASNEDYDFYGQLPDIFKCRPEHYIASMLYWIQRQNKENAMRTIISHLSEDHRLVFMQAYAELSKLFVCKPYPRAQEVLKCIERSKDEKLGLLSKINQDDFEFNVNIGRVAIPFINLKNTGTLSGSWVVGDKNRENAMLVATDIALYAQGLLTNSQDCQISFIGRKYNKSHMQTFKKKIYFQNEPKMNTGKEKMPIDHFENFVEDHLPGFSFTSLQPLPEACWITLISLLYYGIKANRDVTKEACCIILSCVILGPVAENVGVIKRSNFSITHGVKEHSLNDNRLTYEHSMSAANAVIDLFYLPERGLSEIFDRYVLHTFAEIQHCIQYMNYLNKLCGEKIKCTAYDKAINCTFIYNLYIALKDKSSHEKYIKTLLNCSPVFLCFKNILDTYEQCLASIKVDKD